MNRTFFVTAMLIAGSVGITRSHVAAQDLEVFGFWRSDGVILPALYWTANGWSPVPYTLEPGPFTGVDRYYARDSLGLSSVVEAGEPALVCCNDTGEAIWGHTTDVSGPDVEMYAMGRQGYVLSSPGGEAPFAGSSQELSADRIGAILDSVSPISRARETRVDTQVWESEVDGVSAAFFQVRQSGGTDGWAACFFVFGWLSPAGADEVSVASTGEDDCEGKGVGRRRPLALIRRAGEVYAIVEVLLYDGRSVEVWRKTDDRRWARVVRS